MIAQFADGYPPPEHMLRDLGISLELTEKEKSVAYAPVVREICTDQDTLQVGVMATLVDIVGGALSLRATYPDWVATSELSIHTSARMKGGVIVAAGSLIRNGRNTLVIGVEIYERKVVSDANEKAIGSALMTYSRLPRKEDVPESKIGRISRESFQFINDGSKLREPYLHRAGLRILDETSGRVELIMSEYVRNSIRSLQGGMVAVLGDIAGQCVARANTGRSFLTSDLEIHYIFRGKIGPFRTKTQLIRKTADTVLSRVQVADMGAGGRTVAIIMNTATGPPPSLSV
jgi:acyl-coenzyme A thioesterase PaaI-like protein